VTLTKTHLIDAIAKQGGFTRNKSSETYVTLMESIKATPESVEDIQIGGFGKFCVKEKRERRGRNPATGVDMIPGPRRMVTFNCSGKLREKINE